MRVSLGLFGNTVGLSNHEPQGVNQSGLSKPMDKCGALPRSPPGLASPGPGICGVIVKFSIVGVFFCRDTQFPVRRKKTPTKGGFVRNLAILESKSSTIHSLGCLFCFQKLWSQYANRFCCTIQIFTFSGHSCWQWLYCESLGSEQQPCVYTAYANAGSRAGKSWRGAGQSPALIHWLRPFHFSMIFFLDNIFFR